MVSLLDYMCIDQCVSKSDDGCFYCNTGTS